MKNKEIFATLSKREQQIVIALLETPTASNADIAKRQNKAEKTIERQFNSMYKRLKITGDPCQKRITLILMFKWGATPQT